MVVDIRDTISGSIGAIYCVYAGLPFDVAKVRLQTQGSPPIYTGTFNCVMQMARKEGLRALWKGAIPAVSSAGIENAVLFSANGALQRIIFSKFKAQQTELNHTQELFVLAGIGGLSGAFSATAITPAEMVKCRMQFQRGKSTYYKSPLDCLVKVVKSDGVPGLFRGLPAVWMRDIPFNFFFFGAYEGYSALFRSLLKQEVQSDLSPLYVLCAGGLAGATGWSIVFPFDSVKSKLQVGSGSEGPVQVARTIFHKHGLRGFYHGWSAAVLRAFPANGALFMGYETCSRLFAWLDDPNK